MSGFGNAKFNDNSSISGSDPNFLYYNATIINNSTQTTSTTNDPDIRFQDSRALPLLKDKSKYAISVENFSISGAGKALPLFIPQIRQYQGNSTTIPNTNPNNTIYDITLTWQFGGTKNAPTGVIQSTRTVQWIPENQAVWTVQPPVPYAYPQPEIDYYHCYTYSHWVNLVNSALACAWGDIKEAVSTLTPPLNKMGMKCPFFTYDEKTNLFSLYQDANTSVVPYGSSVGTAPSNAGPSNPPNPLNVYGPAASDSTYQAGEYSFVGYNTNFESLLTNFNSTYYSDHQIYPPTPGYFAYNEILITTPIGTESCAESVQLDAPFSAGIYDWSGSTIEVANTTNAGTILGTSWQLAPQVVTDTTSSAQTITVNVNATFTTNLNDTQSYFVIGERLSVTASSGGGSFTGDIVAFSGNTLVIYPINVVVGTISSNWTFVSAPLTSTTTFAPGTIVPSATITLDVNLTPEESFLSTGCAITVQGSIGSFTGDIAPTGFGQTLNFSGPIASTTAGTLSLNTCSATAGLTSITLFINNITGTIISTIGVGSPALGINGTVDRFHSTGAGIGYIIIDTSDSGWIATDSLIFTGGATADITAVSFFRAGDSLLNGVTSATATISSITGSADGSTDTLEIISIAGGVFSTPNGVADTNNSTSGIVSGFTASTSFILGEPIIDTTNNETTSVLVTSNMGNIVVNTISQYNGPSGSAGLTPFEVGDTVIGSTSGVSAVITSISNTTLDIVVSTVTNTPLPSWTIIPTPITSSTSIIPSIAVLPFVTNLTTTQFIWLTYKYDYGTNTGVFLTITDVSSTLNYTQLYYPENVVDVNAPGSSPASYDLCHPVSSIQLGSVFLSGTTPSSPPYYVRVTQDYESTSTLWSPVATIVLATTFITVREEYSGTPITIGTGNLGSNATTASFQKVLIEVPLDNITPQVGWRGYLYYEPKVETLSSLGLSKDSLKNLDIQFYWRNRLTNSLNPLVLYNGGSATARLLFKKVEP